ncbi:Uncharacterized protein Fot_18197 [Forsythia ovata]|uniref:Uncharacterized protein n=1 Tax=Forsythia ovata TaxID=205694 RepID=A0ABD1VHH3_9LAMI
MKNFTWKLKTILLCKKKHSHAGQAGRLLVAFFGDGSCSWCLPSQLISFVENFEEMSKDGSSKTFLNAVQRSVDEVGRLLESNLTCKCIPEELKVGLPRPLVANAGIICHGDGDLCATILKEAYSSLSRTKIPLILAIIQGLRESGVFSSVISSAQGTLSKDKFLASIVSSNSSTAVASQSHPSRKIGRNRESQATARKTLEMTAFPYHEAAVPPLSPPLMDHDLII